MTFFSFAGMAKAQLPIQSAQQAIDVIAVEARQIGIVGAAAQDVENFTRPPYRRLAGRQHVAVRPVILAVIGARPAERIAVIAARLALAAVIAGISLGLLHHLTRH